jgi:hypothetical protein
MLDISPSRGYEPIREHKIDDRKYELLSRGPYSCCGVEMFEVWRWSGASFSRYKTPKNFTAEEFVTFIELIDEQLLQSSSELLEEFHTKLQNKNSGEGIYADYSYAFRLMEYGRQKTSALERLNCLRVLTSNDAPKNKTEQAARLSFELGYAAAEYRLIEVYEDYVHDDCHVRVASGGPSEGARRTSSPGDANPDRGASGSEAPLRRKSVSDSKRL